MSKRIPMLEKMVAAGAQDPFVWYALALEYSNLERIDDALKTFEALKAFKSDYVPMYYMCGTMLVKHLRIEEGRAWLTTGLEVANRVGDGHAAGEIQGALASLPGI